MTEIYVHDDQTDKGVHIYDDDGEGIFVPHYLLLQTISNLLRIYEDNLQ